MNNEMEFTQEERLAAAKKLIPLGIASGEFLPSITAEGLANPEGHFWPLEMLLQAICSENRLRRSLSHLLDTHGCGDVWEPLDINKLQQECTACYQAELLLRNLQKDTGTI